MGAQQLRLRCAAAAAAVALLRAQPQPVRYSSYGELVERMRALTARAPQFARLYSVQERHGLQSPGACGDAPCAHWVLEITNFGSANASDAWGGGAVRPNDLAHRPQVFLSGNLHGDEQVGPMTLIHAAELLVGQRAAGGHPWVDRTVDTRRLLVMPMTNPLGYHRVQRSENGMDPNRDFAFRQAPAACMTTLTARAVNEVWRENLVTAALTFHGGMQAIGYEWGSENHMDHASESPDDRGQFLLAHVMANMAGALRGERYPVNRINSIVYPVDGGMEDWAYGGSWDAPSQVVCTPGTYGGYPEHKTTYNDAQLRAFNVIIEASDAKRPDEASLGALDASDPAQALAVEGDGDGHVPRNLRLTLAAVDLVAPYVHVTRTSATAGGGANGGGGGGGGGGGDARRLGGALSAAAGAAGAHREGVGAGGDSGADPLEEARARAPSMTRQYAALQQLMQGEADAAHARRLHRQQQQQQRQQQQQQQRRAGSAGVGASVPGARSAAERDPRRHPRRQLSVGGSGPAVFAGYSSGVVAASPAGLFTGPGACVAAAGGACNDAHRGDYTHWLSLPADEAGAAADAAATVTVKVGWDVGGAVSVDATSLLVGTWDVRVPPQWLTGAPVHAPDNLDARAADATKSAAAGRLAAECGLSPPEAAAFVDYLHAWQLFAAGRVTLAGLPTGVALRHSPPRHGVTRWVFGSLGTQPTDNVDGASVLGERVEGSPDLARAPYVTRFADCFRVTLPRGAGAGAALTVGECAEGEGAGGGGARGLQGATTTTTSSSSVTTYYHGLLAVPYAAVDANWREQSSPEPANTPPQSHMVNARTTSDWRKENNGFVVQGRLHAIGQPVFVGIELGTGAGAAAGVDAGAAAAGSPSASASGTPSVTESPTASASASSSGSPAAASVGASPTAATSVSGSGSPSGSSGGTPSSSASVSPQPSPSGSASASASGSSAAAPAAAGAAGPAATDAAAASLPQAAAAPSPDWNEDGEGTREGEQVGHEQGSDETEARTRSEGGSEQEEGEGEEAGSGAAGGVERPPAAVAASPLPPPAGSFEGSGSGGGSRMAGGAQVALLTASIALVAYFGALPASRFVRTLVAGGDGSARSGGGGGGSARVDEDEDDDDGLDEEAQQLVDATAAAGRWAGGGGRGGPAGARGSYTRGPGRPSGRARAAAQTGAI